MLPHTAMYELQLLQKISQQIITCSQDLLRLIMPAYCTLIHLTFSYAEIGS